MDDVGGDIFCLYWRMFNGKVKFSFSFSEMHAWDVLQDACYKCFAEICCEEDILVGF